MIDSNTDPQQSTIGQLMAQVARLIGNRLRGKMEGIGLQHAQGQMLVHLWHHDGIPQNELAQAMHVKPATATNTLQRMERNGWIERFRDETDQRIVRVHLTQKARKLHAEVRTSFHELDAEMTDDLTDDERELLRQSLVKVRKRLIKDMV